MHCSVAKSTNIFTDTSGVRLITIKEVAEIEDAAMCAETYWHALPLFCLSVMLETFVMMGIGHSLGAGVASLAAPWAALQWPGADIRCVTFGNPKPGNQAYSDVGCHFPSPLLLLVSAPSPLELSLACRLPTFTDSLTHLLAESFSACLP